MTPVVAGVDAARLGEEVERLLRGAPPGASLTPVTRALIRYAACSAVTTLDRAGARVHAAAALDAGATAEHLQEVLTLVSALGVHTLMTGSRDLADLLTARGVSLPDIDDRRQSLRDRLLGGAAFWGGFEAQVPGFLDALLRLSPDVFEGFIAYSALSTRTRALRPVEREIVCVAVDALPQHRYLPGLRLHIDGALRSGAGRAEIVEAVELAAATAPSPGVG